MKNKTLRIIILTIILVLFVQLTSFAALGKITLNTKTDKNTYKVGDKVKVTIDWTKEVEAAGFVLKYDKSKLKFDSTSLGSNFYNADTAGKVLFNWAAFDGKALTKVYFVFTAKEEGSTEIFVEDARGFADENLDKATGYAYKSKTIKISNVDEDVKDEPDTNDKENEIKPNNKPSTDNKNEVLPDNPNIDEEDEEMPGNPDIDVEGNEVLPNNPSVDEEKNETTTKNEVNNDSNNKVDSNEIQKEPKKPPTSTEVKSILLVVIFVNLGLLALIHRKRK